MPFHRSAVLAFAVFVLSTAAVRASQPECTRSTAIEPAEIRSLTKSSFAFSVPSSPGGTPLRLTRDGTVVTWWQGASPSRRDCPRSHICFESPDGSDPRTDGSSYLLHTTLPDHSSVMRTGAAREKAHPLRTPPGYVMSEMRFTNEGNAPLTMLVRDAAVGDTSSVAAILDGILREGMTDAGKAEAIFHFLVARTYHWYAPNAEIDLAADDLHDPVRFVNVYGYGICDDAARNFVILAREAGIPGRVWYLNGHVVAEAFHDGAWHMYDVDHQVFYLRDDGIVASVEDLSRDPSPITATPHDPAGYETAYMAAMYTSADDNRVIEEEYPRPSLLRPRLEPGDEVVFDYAGSALRHFRMTCDGTDPPPSVGNGTLSRDITRQLRSRASESTVTVEWPYLLLDARLEIEFSGDDRDVDLVVRDGRGERSTNLQIRPREGRTVAASFDFSCAPAPTYRIDLTLRAAGRNLSAMIRSARIISTFQFAPAILPGAGSTAVVSVNGTSSRPRAKVEFISSAADCITPAAELTGPTALSIRSGARIDHPHLLVPAGSSVRWTAEEGGHELQFDDGVSTGVIEAGASFARVFPDFGSFRYRCMRHPHPATAGGVIEVFRPVKADFDLDGRADLIWWHRDEAAVHAWHVRAGDVSNSILARQAVSSEWMLDTVGDVNGDGFADFVWRRIATGAVHVWFLRRGQHTGSLVLTRNLEPGWEIVSVLEKREAPAPGIVAYDRDSGRLELWEIEGGDVVRTTPLRPARGVVSIADADGDGVLDYVVWDSVSGELSFEPIDGSTPPRLIGTVAGGDWQPFAVADFDGDGSSDVVWRNSATGQVNVWHLRDGVYDRGRSLGTADDPAWSIVRQ
jgi:hypothetical protein